MLKLYERSINEYESLLIKNHAYKRLQEFYDQLFRKNLGDVCTSTYIRFNAIFYLLNMPSTYGYKLDVSIKDYWHDLLSLCPHEKSPDYDKYEDMMNWFKQ